MILTPLKTKASASLTEAPPSRNRAFSIGPAKKLWKAALVPRSRKTPRRVTRKSSVLTPWRSTSRSRQKRREARLLLQNLLQEPDLQRISARVLTNIQTKILNQFPRVRVCHLLLVDQTPQGNRHLHLGRAGSPRLTSRRRTSSR